MVGKYLVEEEMSDSIEYSDRTKQFRLKLRVSDMPEQIQKAVRGCSKDSVSIFEGKKMRVRILPYSLLPSQLVARIKAIVQPVTFVDCVEKMLEERQKKREKLGMDFYRQISRLEKLFKCLISEYCFLSNSYGTNLLSNS